MDIPNTEWNICSTSQWLSISMWCETIYFLHTKCACGLGVWTFWISILRHSPMNIFNLVNTKFSCFLNTKAISYNVILIFKGSTMILWSVPLGGLHTRLCFTTCASHHENLQIKPCMECAWSTPYVCYTMRKEMNCPLLWHLPITLYS